jgi:gliding motility-associated-like protein
MLCHKKNEPRSDACPILDKQRDFGDVWRQIRHPITIYSHLSRIFAYPHPMNDFLIMKRASICSVALLCSLQVAFAQSLTITDATTPPFDPENLITSVFLGNGVEVLDVRFDGVPVAVGYFSGGSDVVGLDRGILLTTGAAATTGTAVGGDGIGSDLAIVDNNSFAFDADLAAQVMGAPLRNVAVYEITFVPNADTLRFSYVFCSEEYPEFACSVFNDVFGFFIEGPGYPTPTNIARIPGTGLPVTINNLHPDNSQPGFNCPPVNEQFYNDNNFSNNQPVYDGFTDVFVAEAVVQPCQEYTIKLAIADVLDGGFDSGVFLQAKSFGTGALEVSLETRSPENAIAEGCASGLLTFTLPNPQLSPYSIDYQLFGTAQNGVDFEAFPPNLVIPPGETTLSIPIVPLEDGVVEGVETIIIDIQRDFCTRDTIQLSITDNRLPAADLGPDTTTCQGAAPILLDGTLPLVLPAPPSFSNSNQLPILPENTAVFSEINVSGVAPALLGPGVIRSVCINIDHPWVDDLDILLVSPGGQFVELSTDNGADGDNYTNTCFTPNAGTPINFPGPFAPASAAPFTGDWLPEGPFEDLWGGPANGIWQLRLLDDSNGFTGTLNDWTITFEPGYKLHYSWTPAIGLSCIDCPITETSPIAETTYVLTVDDSYGCVVEDSVFIEVQQSLPAPQITCAVTTADSVVFSWSEIPGATTYEVNVNGNGWVPVGTDTFLVVSGINTPLTPTQIEVQAVDGVNNCAAGIGTATCFNCTGPAVTATVQQVSCAGAADGEAVVNVSGGMPPFSFELNGQINATGLFEDLTAGQYTVTITDSDACPTTVVFSVSEPDSIDLSINILEQILCNGGTNAVLSANATGGNGGYVFNWSTGQSGPAVDSLSAGGNTVTVTDSEGCIAVDSVVLEEPDPLTVSLAVDAPVNCFGDSSGVIVSVVNGGIAPFQYQWSDGQTGVSAAQLPAGTYRLTVSDANGCTGSDSTSIAQPPSIVVDISLSPPLCHNQKNGSISASANGGTGGLQYLWSNGSTTPTLSNLSSGNYSLTVTDSNMCTSTQVINLPNPDALDWTSNSVPTNCALGMDGIATVTPSGGTAPYTFQWSDPGSQTNSVATNLSAGSYFVTITDNNNCSTTGLVVVEEPEAVLLNFKLTEITCNGRMDGAIESIVTGGVPPYSYLWDNGASSPNQDGLEEGSYNLVVTDGNGCSTGATAFLDVLNPISVNAQIVENKCHGAANGSIDLVINGGFGNYTVSWQSPIGPLSGQKISNLPAGEYLFTVVDSSDCTISDTVSIEEPELPLQTGISASTDTLCFGAENGSVSSNPGGGTPPYSFAWSNGEDIPGIENLAAGNYRLTLTDANGCTTTGSLTIVEQAPLSIELTGLVPTCFNNNDGSASVSSAVLGADPIDPNQLIYSWNTVPLQVGVMATGLTGGRYYTVTATNTLGCSVTDSIYIERPAPINVLQSVSSPVSCPGGADGLLETIASGGTTPYQFSISPNTGIQQGNMFQNLDAGTYRITAIDANGCTGNASFEITEPDPIEVNISGQNIRCFGENSGSASTQTTGGTAPYTYAWSNAAMSPAITGLSAGSYTLTVTDAKGCTQADSVQLIEPVSALGGTADFTEPVCFGGSEGTITIFPNGGTPPYRYALDDGPFNGSPIQIGLNAGLYTPKLIDKNGCTAELPPIQIEQPLPLTVDLGPDITIELGQDTQLLAQVFNNQGPISLYWQNDWTGALGCDFCLDPTVTGLEIDAYYEIQVTDSLRCRGTDGVWVRVIKERKVFVPTGFSPNLDGNNDILLVHGQEETRVLKFDVYDRWGEQVYSGGGFQLNDPNQGWNGQFRGEDCDPGVYVWVLEVEYLDGFREVLKGNTTLVR